MAINIYQNGVGISRTGDFAFKETFVTQSGKHIINTIAQKPQYQIRVLLAIATGENADISEWRAYVASDIVIATGTLAGTWVCPGGLDIDKAHDRNDYDDNAIKYVSFTIVKKEV